MIQALAQEISTSTSTYGCPEVASPFIPGSNHSVVEDDSFLNDSAGYLDGEADTLEGSFGIVGAIPKYVKKLLYGALKRVRVWSAISNAMDTY